MPVYMLYDALNPFDLNNVKKWLDHQRPRLISGEMKSGQSIDRQQIWFHHEAKSFHDDWHYDRWQGHSYDQFLQQLEYMVTNLLPCKLKNNFKSNSCLLNYYSDGSKFISSHIDNTDLFGLNPVIVNLSIGASRTLKVNNRNYQLTDNSLFVMYGITQRHELLKDPSCDQERFSFTFRQHLTLKR